MEDRPPTSPSQIALGTISIDVPADLRVGEVGGGVVHSQIQQRGGDGLVVVNDNPPEYQQELLLLPRTADQSKRYDKPPLRNDQLPRHIYLPAGNLQRFLQKGPLPPGWNEYIHPEGLPYFYNPSRRIVTDTNIREPSFYHLLLRAARILEARAAHQNVMLSAATELVLDLDIESCSVQGSPPTCKYYLIDHAHKSEFWLDQTTTDRLSMPAVTSYPHLKYLLRQHYWMHVEFFPLHVSLSIDVEEELLAILSHACIDFMTSSLSTVPYNQEQCETYMKLINGIPDSDRVNGYRNCVLARLWSEIDSNFFVNLHGEPNVRLSRSQRLLPEPVVEKHRLLQFFKYALFLTTEHYYETLCELWVDGISYAAHWRKFTSENIYTWKAVTFLDLLLLVSSFSTLSISLTRRYTGIIVTIAQTAAFLSIIFSLASLSASLLLIYKTAKHMEGTASDAGEYLERVYHANYGFQPLALVYAFPFGTCVWSLILLGLAVTFLGLTLEGRVPKVLVLLTVATLALAAYFLAWGLQIGGDWVNKNRLFHFWHREDYNWRPVFTSWRVALFRMRVSFWRILPRRRRSGGEMELIA